MSAEMFWTTIGKMVIIAVAVFFWCTILNGMAAYFTEAAHPYFASGFFTFGAILITTMAIEVSR